MPRILQRRNREAAPSASAAATTELPDYQDLECPLSEAARHELGKLTEKRSTGAYKLQLEKSVNYLTTSATDLFERFSTQAAEVETKKRKREEKGLEPSEEDTKLEQHVRRMEQLVLGLGSETEEAVRAAIDGKFELEDEGIVIGGIYTEAATEGVAIRNAGEDAEVELRPILSNYKQGIKRKKHEYKEFNMRDRYAKNNDYAAFTKGWYAEAAGEDGPPLPDVSKWFNSNNELVLSMERVLSRKGLGGVNGVDDDESDDEVAIAREILSLNCPLTLRMMEKPYSNSRCKHTFEERAIWEYLASGEEKQCPQTGCSQTFKKQHWNRDFYLDKTMLRKIQRAKQVQERQDNEDSEDERDQSIYETAHRRKRNKSVKRERASTAADHD